MTNSNKHKMDTPGKLQALIDKIKETSNEFQQQSTRDSLTGSDLSNCSDIDDNEEQLSHAEESAIEECLNDTEGSLSSVDLNIFDDISDDLYVHRTKKTRGKHRSKLVKMDVSGNGKDCDFSLDDTDTRKLQILNEEIKKIRSTLSNSSKKYPDLLTPKTNRRIVKRKRRNSPPIRKNDKTHIYSFFCAMADLVSTFPKDHVEKAKQNVNIILEETVNKLKEWSKNMEQANLTHGCEYDLFDYNLLEKKLAKLQDIN